MENKDEPKIFLNIPQLVLITIFVVIVFSYVAYRYYSLKKDFSRATSSFESTFKNLGESIDRLKNNLASTTSENQDLNDLLTILRAKNSDFQTEITEKNQKVYTYEKLVTTDAELLKKYSKVFFLNDNYIPVELLPINDEFVSNKTKSIQIHAKVKLFLETLLRTAESDQIDLVVLSGYRSFGTQASLKSQYKVTYGTGANKFSADQGYSEHQLGSAVDFTTRESGEILAGFDSTTSYKWLQNNAYRFGFILSYPKNNDYYVFEPWHWRFVGVALATDLHNAGMNFYDMPERGIDAYLVKLFD